MMTANPRLATKSRRTALVVFAAVGLVILGCAFISRAHRHAAAQSGHPPPEDYATNLAFTEIKTSQAYAISGVRTVSLEGHISNRGSATVTGITVAVTFDNDNDADLETHSVPVLLLPTQQPRADTGPENAVSLAPHSEREFRVTFTNVGENWNQQQPEMKVIDVQTR